MTPQQAIQEIERRMAEWQRALQQVADEVLEKAIEFSSGGKSLKALARMDHPYAKRHGSSTLPAHIINVQSGEFRNTWRVEKAGTNSLRVINDAPVVRHLKSGRGFMVERPIEHALREYARHRLGLRFPGRIR